MTFKTQAINPSIKHKGHPVNANARKIFHFLRSKKASKAKKISLETQLEIANLKYENEELTKKNAKLTYTQTEVTAVTELFFTTSWCSRSDNKIEETST